MKILLHNLSRTFGNYVPETFDFDQNSFFFAEEGDVVITRNTVQSASYHRFLVEIGAVKEGVLHIYPEYDAGTAVSIFESSEVKDRVQEVLSSRSDATAYQFDIFEMTAYEYRWCKEIGLNPTLEPEVVSTLRKKSTFKRIALDAGVTVPPGYTNIMSFATFVWHAWLLAVYGCERLVTKLDEGARGIGSSVLTRKDLCSFSKMQKLRSELNRTQNSILSHISSTRIIEEWYDDSVFSPSVQFWIGPDGSITHLSTHAQLVSGDVTYNGCRAAAYLPDAIVHSVQTEGMSLARSYRDKGFCGHVGFDAAVRPAGNVVWLEANTHRTLTAYAFQIATRVTGRKEGVVYESLHVVVDGTGRDIATLMVQLGTLLFDPVRGSGIVPYNICLLTQRGEVDMLLVGNDIREVNAMQKELLKIVRSCGQT